MLGVKLEDQQALDRAAETLSAPGLAFAGSNASRPPFATSSPPPIRCRTRSTPSIAASLTSTTTTTTNAATRHSADSHRGSISSPEQPRDSQPCQMC